MADADPAVAEQLFGNFQYEIYERGLAGERPKLPVSLLEREADAREVMSAEAFGYVAGGAGSERTVQANRAAFERLQIVPRMLRDVSSRELSTSILGTEMPAPLLLAPVGVQSIVHPEAELATGRAAASLQIPAILSTAASNSIEQVAEAMGPASRWYQ